jgi:hypothetical protein
MPIATALKTKFTLLDVLPERLFIWSDNWLGSQCRHFNTCI